jgi:hypothetical protein
VIHREQLPGLSPRHRGDIEGLRALTVIAVLLSITWEFRKRMAVSSGSTCSSIFQGS